MPAIIDALYMLIKADTSDLKKGLKEAEEGSSKLNESTKKSNDLTKKLGLSFSDLAAEFTALVATFVSVGSIIDGLKSAADYSQGLFIASQQLGSSTEEIDAWSRAVAKQGGSLQSFEGSLTALQNSLNTLSISPNNELVATFYKLGISVRDSKGGIKSALSLIYELAKASEHLKPQQAKALFSQLHLDPATIQLILQGQQGLEKMIETEKKLGVTTVENSRVANQFHNAWLDASQAFTVVFENINNDILPVLTKLLQGVTKIAVFLQGHASVLTGSLIGLAAAISYELIPAIVALNLALAPEVAVVLALVGLGAAIGYAYEKLKDLNSESENSENAIMKWKKAPTLFQKLKEYLSELGGIFSNIADKSIEDWEKFEKTINRILNLIVQGRDAIRDFLGISTIRKAIGSQFHKLDIFNNPEDIKLGQEALANTANLPLALQNATTLQYSNPINNKSLNVDVGNITIQTQATSSEEIASSFKENLINQVRLAINQHNDGVVI